MGNKEYQLAAMREGQDDYSLLGGWNRKRQGEMQQSFERQIEEEQLARDLAEGPQEPWFDRFKRRLDELAGAAGYESLPDSPKEAQLRALQGTLGIGGAALSAADPADVATSEAFRQGAEDLGLGELGQGAAEIVGGLASGVGGGDVARVGAKGAGLFASLEPDAFKKFFDKDIRDATARFLRRQKGSGGLLEKGTPSREAIMDVAYSKDPTRGIKIKSIPADPKGTKGQILLRDEAGNLLDQSQMEIPATFYSEAGLEAVAGHETGHDWIERLRNKVAQAVKRKAGGGAPLTSEETRAAEVYQSLLGGGKARSYRAEGDPVRQALEELGSYKWKEPHSRFEEAADLISSRGRPGAESYAPLEALTTRDPWTAQTPGAIEDIPMVEEQLRALRR